MWEHGACNVQKVSSPTLREWCHRPWGPVNAAVPRAWRRGRGELHTVFTRIPAGRACSTATRSTPWETRRTATGGLQADVWRVSSKRYTTIIINIYSFIYIKSHMVLKVQEEPDKHTKKQRVFKACLNKEVLRSDLKRPRPVMEHESWGRWLQSGCSDPKGSLTPTSVFGPGDTQQRCINWP